MHLKRVHAEADKSSKVFSCGVEGCGYTTTTKAYFQRHNHDKRLKCEACDFETTVYGEYSQHMRSAHKREKVFK